MKKIITYTFIVFFQFFNVIFAIGHTDFYNNAIEKGEKIFSATWPFEFQNKDHLYDFSSKINLNDKNNASLRYKRMLHIKMLTNSKAKKMMARLDNFSKNASTLVSYIEKEIFNQLGLQATVQHVSIYGSYLYNDNPDDIDLLVVVDSPQTIFLHLEVPATTVFGLNGLLFPKLSFQVIDYNTYLYAKEHSKMPFDHLPRNEKLALQQLTVAANWHYSIYGFDLRYNNPSSLETYMQENFLHKAFITLNGAGERLYKTAYAYLPYETDPVRLKKVVSRLLITEFSISALKKSFVSPKKVYDNLYAEIKNLKESDSENISIVSKKIENLYLKKLKQLLELADEHQKLNELKAKKY